jgi:hypothetical protein
MRFLQFVAHPSCQQKLVSIWYDDLRSLERSNWFQRSMMAVCITLSYPFLAILYWVAPKSKVMFILFRMKQITWHIFYLQIKLHLNIDRIININHHENTMDIKHYLHSFCDIISQANRKI